jgi:hypothetical protein
MNVVFMHISQIFDLFQVLLTGIFPVPADYANRHYQLPGRLIFFSYLYKFLGSDKQEVSGDSARSVIVLQVAAGAWKNDS